MYINIDISKVVKTKEGVGNYWKEPTKVGLKDLLEISQ